MSNPPPPPTPTSPPGPTRPSLPAPATARSPSQSDRVLATTGQLAAALEDVGLSVDESALESFLLAADRRGYLEWTALTRSGEHVWDLTDAPDRFADAIASALLEWLAARFGLEGLLERDGDR